MLPKKKTAKGLAIHINDWMYFVDTGVSFHMMERSPFDSEIEEDSTILRCELGHPDRERFDGFRLASTHPYKRAWDSSLGAVSQLFL